MEDVSKGSSLPWDQLLCGLCWVLMTERRAPLFHHGGATTVVETIKDGIMPSFMITCGRGCKKRVGGGWKKGDASPFRGTWPPLVNGNLLAAFKAPGATQRREVLCLLLWHATSRGRWPLDGHLTPAAGRGLTELQ